MHLEFQSTRLPSISLKSTALYSVSVNLNLLFFSNIIKSPEDEKYRKVKTQNKAFSSKVWSLPEAQEFLILWGWDQVWRLMIDYFCQQSDDNNNNNNNNNDNNSNNNNKLSPTCHYLFIIKSLHV